MKNSVSYILFAAALLSCTSPEQKADGNKKLVLQYFEYFNLHNWKEMANMYTETAEFKDPSFGQAAVKQTRQQVIKKYAALNQIFPDLNDRIISIYSSGEKNVIVEFISTGTGAGHSKFSLPVCSIFTIENDMIIKDFTYYDNSEE